MGAAYTLYKFKNVFGLVLTIAIFLILFSQIMPALSQAKEQVLEASTASLPEDTSNQVINAYAIYDSIPDPPPPPPPEGTVKITIGEHFYNLIVENPGSFFIVILLISAVLFIIGVRLRSLRMIKGRIF
jgi:hypothetical protein